MHPARTEGRANPGRLFAGARQSAGPESQKRSGTHSREQYAERAASDCQNRALSEALAYQARAASDSESWENVLLAHEPLTRTCAGPSAAANFRSRGLARSQSAQ